MKTIINIPSGRQVISATESKKFALFQNLTHSKRIRWTESRPYQCL